MYRCIDSCVSDARGGRDQITKYTGMPELLLAVSGSRTIIDTFW